MALALGLIGGVWPVIVNVLLYLVTGLIDVQMLTYTLNMNEFLADISTNDDEILSIAFLYPLLFLGSFVLNLYLNS